MTRQRIILALVIVIAIGSFIFDLLFTRGGMLPALLFALPSIMAVFYLSPRTVALVAAATLLLRLPRLAMLGGPVRTEVSYVLALAIIGFLSAMVADRMKSQAAINEERGRLMARLRQANEDLEHEVSERRAEGEALRASEERYRALAETARDMIFIVGRDGTMEYVNTFAAEQFQVRPEEIIGKRREALFPPEVSTRQEQGLQEVFRTGKPIYRETCTAFPGHALWLDTWLAPLRDAAGEVAAVMGISRDITQRKQYEQQLAYQASHDSLTDLFNRRSLEAAMDTAVARARRGVSSTVLLLDVDDFKAVNDARGHVVGDRVLISLASLLQKELRFEDLLARVGGDEFAVLLMGANSLQGELVAARMCRAVKEFDFSVDGLGFALGLSIGMAVIDGSQDTATVLAQADAAMYIAKQQGGSRTVLHEA
ncbi:MAG: diguanylate cyclase [Chloroflexi bacterium]|nr:diguanylate cyclase [Chloroflexota bacterium]